MKSAMKIWIYPVLLGLLSLIALLMALFFENAIDVACAIFLTIPALVAIWFGFFYRRI